MTHKEKDVLIGDLVDTNVSLKRRVDYLEGQNYETTIQELKDNNEALNSEVIEIELELYKSESMKNFYLADIRDLYKRLDGKNEDIQILNSLIND